MEASPIHRSAAQVGSDDLAFATVETVARYLQRGDITAMGLCEETLDRVLALNPGVGAYSDVVGERALDDADASDKRRRLGKSLGTLDGIPIAVKDLIDTVPARCKGGLNHLSGYYPHQDASVVRQLRAAGAVIIGVAETDSGAFGTSTPAVVNPVAPNSIAGGSSGGSAAAVAAGLAYAAIGTDTAGSIRIPSYCCSTYGFKPSWGRVPLDGIRPLAPSLDHVGPMARCVADLHILQAVLDPEGFAISPAGKRPLRIGVSEDYYADAEPQIKSALAAILTSVGDADIEVRHLSIPNPERTMKVHMVSAVREIADYHICHFRDVWESYPGVAKSTVELGASVNAEDFEKAEDERRKLRFEVEQAFGSVDILMLPILPMHAPFRNERQVVLDDKSYPILAATVRYTALFSQTGHPVVAMPGLRLLDGRGLGIQLIGKLGSDAELLSNARILEEILAVSIDYAALAESQLEQVRNTRLSIDQETSHER
jgi:aspartyl-tRNA(Asn)/glutamyl-tRNA(Gln) amidotransferase subunit A